MRLTGLLAAVFSLSAGAALACPAYEGCGRVDHHRHAEWSQERRDSGYERCAEACAPPPCFENCGEVVLSDGFFDGAGGVGPIPDGSWYVDSGFFVIGAGAGSHASAFASARASAHASVSVRYRGGFRGHHGHKGHKGGKRR